MAPLYYILVALPCTAGAIALAIIHIYRHLMNYTEPTYQRYIVRIIFMVPVYALMSFLSLVLNDSSIYFNSIREVLGHLQFPLVVPGVGRWSRSCCVKSKWSGSEAELVSDDMRFIRRCKQGGLQFVILKPMLVAVTFILYAKGKYHDGNFSAKQSYLYLTIIYTISYSTALYALALFYVACRDLLQPFNPVPKFIIIKSVVFLTYWQGVLVFLAAKTGLIKDADEAAEFQNFIICVEMLIAAVGHLYAFPYKEYAGANIGVSRGFTASLGHALKLNDFYHDTVHQFAPTYHDYVLYNHSEGDDGAKKYRARTFVPTGPEMDTVRRNKHVFGSKIDDIQLSSLSSSGSSTPQNSGTVQGTAKAEAIDSSLLMDSSNSVSVPYDLSLIDIDMSNYSTNVPAAKEAGTR
ncbi:hypothetical protein RJ639_038904 [Escallonia herrerae]|uniref:Transmembrane protein 184B n=1 Tax=Escallonia herrerae TaxID=1293975 RepID=A0AA89BFQ8_9ASTE|nr:hypothetical protein RJ639_038904 [Escallonia herrerae]